MYFSQIDDKYFVGTCSTFGRNVGPVAILLHRVFEEEQTK